MMGRLLDGPKRQPVSLDLWRVAYPSPRDHPPEVPFAGEAYASSICIASAKRQVHVKLSERESAILSVESGAVSLLLLLLARAGVTNPGSLRV
jgi:hypothetical protein